FDLDVFVLLEQAGLLVSLTLIYDWARRRNYDVQNEHIVIATIPVQVVPAPNELAAEAVINAVDLDYDGQLVRVMTPEYLLAMFDEESARPRTRLERAVRLLDQGDLDLNLLHDLVERYDLRLPPRA